MTYYARAGVYMEAAENQSFHDSLRHPVASGIFTVTEGAIKRVEVAANPATTIALGNYPSPLKGILIENLGTTAATYITATLRNAAAASVAFKIPIAAEGINFMFTPDCLTTADLTLLASAGTITCRVSLFG